MRKIFFFFLNLFLLEAALWCGPSYSYSHMTAQDGWIVVLILLLFVVSGVIFSFYNAATEAKKDKERLMAEQEQLLSVIAQKQNEADAYIERIKEYSQQAGALRIRAEQADERIAREVAAEKEKLSGQYTVLIEEMQKKLGHLARMEEDVKTAEKFLAKKVAAVAASLGVSKADACEKALEHISIYFCTKPRPSYESKEIIRMVKKELRKLKEEAKSNECIINTYESIFPWLTDFKEMPVGNLAVEENVADPEQTVEKYLSAEEKHTLTKAEKFQRALDRYENSYDKSNWQIGLFYERFIAYKYEIAAWKVLMNGAKKKLEDMGIDLICTKDRKTELVQCKYWSKDKTIYEKYIFQLFGTAINYIFDNFPQLSNNPIAAINKKIVVPVFITSTELSETAKRMASVLGVEVRERVALDKSYPKIKCNPGAERGRIYHLPFDQQYDNFQISQTPGAFYAKTIREAEEKGFSRAFRWHSIGD